MNSGARFLGPYHWFRARLAGWATTPARTSDAYLVQLARANDLERTTFDLGIADPAVELISSDACAEMCDLLINRARSQPAFALRDRSREGPSGAPARLEISEAKAEGPLLTAHSV